MSLESIVRSMDDAAINFTRSVADAYQNITGDSATTLAKISFGVSTAAWVIFGAISKSPGSLIGALQPIYYYNILTKGKPRSPESVELTEDFVGANYGMSKYFVKLFYSMQYHGGLIISATGAVRVGLDAISNNFESMQYNLEHLSIGLALFGFGFGYYVMKSGVDDPPKKRRYVTAPTRA